MIARRQLSEAELESIAHLVPDPTRRSAVRAAAGEPVPDDPLRVSEPLLDGNESRYVAECISGNWISSAGGFVRELRAAVRGCGLLRARRRLLERDCRASPGPGGCGVGRGRRGADPGVHDDRDRERSPLPRRDAGAASTPSPTPATSTSPWRRRELTPRTRAIVPVHVYGHPVEAAPLRRARRRARPDRRRGCGRGPRRALRRRAGRAAWATWPRSRSTPTRS